MLLRRRVFIEEGESIRQVVYIKCNQRDANFSHPWEPEEEEEEEEEEKEGEEEDREDESCWRSFVTRDSRVELALMGLQDLAAGDLLGILQPGDLVILDNLQMLTKLVEHLINYGAHHFCLVVFIVTQTCLGSPLYSLIKPVHNIVLLFAHNSISNLARHIKNTYFLCSNTQNYLGRNFASAERSKSVVVLKINLVATSPIHRFVLAFSGLEGLFCC